MIKKTLCALSAALLVVACSPKESAVDTTPEFPEVSVEYVDAGSSVSLTFEANMDWELRIPSDKTAWFNFMDEGMAVYSLKGGKGRITVEVYAREVETSTQQSTDINMTMGGKTQKIATVYVNPAVREIHVYAGLMNAEGSFTPAGGGEYEYESVETTSLTLTWPAGMTSYTLPLLIESNFKWSMSGMPAWLNPTKTSTDGGRTALVLHADATKIPLEDASGKISFMDLTSSKVVSELSIVIKGCKNIAYVDASSMMELNILGQYSKGGTWSSEGYPVQFTATSDSDIVPVLVADGKLSYSSNPWVKISRTEDQGKEVVKAMEYHVSASRNTSAERTAWLLAIPGAVLKGLNLSSDLFNADKTALKAQYEAYKFATLVQDGVMDGESWGSVVPLNSAYKMAVYGGGISRTPASDASYNAIKNKYSTTEIYTLNLNNVYSTDKVALMVDNFSSVKYFAVSAEKDSDANISAAKDDAGVVSFSVTSFKDSYETAVIFMNGSSAVAAVIVRMNSNYWPKVDYRNIYFQIEDIVTPQTREEMMPKGAVLKELTSGELYEKYKSYGIPVWKISYETVESMRNAMIYVPPFAATDPSAIVIEQANKSWLSAEGAVTEEVKTTLHVKMTAEDSAAGKTGTIVLMGGGQPLFALECERQFIN